MSVIYLNYVYIEIGIFYTEYFVRKVVLWCYFMSETCEKIQNSSYSDKKKFTNEMTPTFPKNLEISALVYLSISSSTLI